MASSTVEDYVKQILLLEQAGGGADGQVDGNGGGQGGGGGGHSGGLVGLGMLAEAMGVVPGTVTTMVKALSDAGLVEYEPRRGVKLTPGGQKLALHVLRRHRLIELFLVRVLKLDWSEVHEEAEALEHALSEKVVDRLDEMLGFPQVDPHGDPIPTGAGVVSMEKTRPLGSCCAGDEVRIVRVDNRDPGFLRYAEKEGLIPGTVLCIQRREPASDAVCVILGEGTRQVTLGMAAAARILVSL